MDQEFEQDLHRRLDALRARGQRRLAADDRRRAARVAARRVAYAAPTLALACLGLRLTSGIGVAALWALCGAAMLPVFLVAYALGRRRHVARRSALALFDGQLRSKDRIVASAEFAALPGRGGFHDAALEEARPWLDRALAVEIDRKTAARARPVREWGCVAAAVAVLLTATLVEKAGGAARGAGGIGNGARAVLAAIGMKAKTAAIDRRDTADGDGARAARGAVPAAAPGSAGESGAVQSASSDRVAASDAAGSGGRTPAGTAGTTAAQASDPSAGAPAASSSQASAGRGAAAGAGGAAQAAAETAAPAAPAAADGSQASASPPNSARKPQVSSPSATSSGMGAGTTPPRQAAKTGAGTPPPGGRREPSGGEDPQQGGTPSNERGEGGPAKAGTGADALKRSRGTSGLLLAVPADDRLSGMANTGPVASMQRPAMPQAWRSAPAAAQARGAQGGDAGVVPHRPASRHEDRVTRSFFHRGGMAPADAEPNR